MNLDSDTHTKKLEKLLKYKEHICDFEGCNEVFGDPVSYKDYFELGDEKDIRFIDLSGRDLTWTRFENVNLQSADLSNCKLNSVSFFDSNMKGVKLRGSYIGTVAWLDGCDLSGADLRGM